MSTRNSAAVAAIAGGAMLTLSLSPVSAFTLAGPSLEQSVATSQIDRVWWRGGCGWGRCGGWGWRGYGWGPGAFFGGALLGSAIAGPGYYGGYYGPGYRHCWRGYYGRLHCTY